MSVSGTNFEKGGAEVVWQGGRYHNDPGCRYMPCCREAGHIFHISEK